MISAAWVLAASVEVTDAKGNHFTPIPKEGAEAIADVCTRDPLFGNEKTCAETLLVMCARESGYGLLAVGDGGKARGPFQLHVFDLGMAAPKTWAEAVAQYVPVLKKSITRCPLDAHGNLHPLALVASGRCDRGWKLERERLDEVKRIDVVMKTKEPKS